MADLALLISCRIAMPVCRARKGERHYGDHGKYREKALCCPSGHT